MPLRTGVTCSVSGFTSRMLLPRLELVTKNPVTESNTTAVGSCAVTRPMTEALLRLTSVKVFAPASATAAIPRTGSTATASGIRSRVTVLDTPPELRSTTLTEAEPELATKATPVGSLTATPRGWLPTGTVDFTDGGEAVRSINETLPAPLFDTTAIPSRGLMATPLGLTSTETVAVTVPVFRSTTEALLQPELVTTARSRC